MHPLCNTCFRAGGGNLHRRKVLGRREWQLTHYHNVPVPWGIHERESHTELLLHKSRSAHSRRNEISRRQGYSGWASSDFDGRKLHSTDLSDVVVLDGAVAAKTSAKNTERRV
jgi:hypothetical protein